MQAHTMLKLIAHSPEDEDTIVYDIPVHMPFETFRLICINLQHSPDPTETLIDELADFFETMFSEDVATYMTDSLVSWVYATQDCGYKIQLSYVVDFEQNPSEVVEQTSQPLD